MSKKSKRTSKASRAEKDKLSKPFLFNATLIGFCLLVFYPPFFRGLFFKTEQQWTLLLAVLIFTLCCLWQMSKSEYRFFYNFQGIAVFCFLLAYVIAFFGAADSRLAVAEIVKTAIYFCVFWTAGRLAAERESSKTVMTVLYFSGLCVALAGFLSAVEAIKIKDGFIGGRIYSTLQYPNALAIYLGALLCFGFYLWLTSSGWQRILFATGNFVMLLVFFGTNSRGGFLVFSGMLVLFFILLPGAKKIPWLGHVVFLIPTALLCSGRVVPAAVEKTYQTAWLWFLAGCVATAVIHFAGQRFAGGSNLTLGVFSKKKIAVAALVCIIVVAGTAVYLSNAGGSQTASTGAKQAQAWYYKVLPENIAERISSISLKENSAQARIYWTLEAFDLVKEHPVLGFGGGAWEAAYQQFQDYPYSSTQVHNHFLQVWIEVGTVGLLIYLAIWVFLLLGFWKNYLNATDSGEKTIEVALSVAAIGLGVHSFIDFDLSLSAIAIVLWTCFGLTWGRNLKNTDTEKKDISNVSRLKKAFVSGTVLFSLVFFGLSSSLLLSTAYAQDGVALAQSGNLEKAEKYLITASRFDPFSPDIRATLATVKSANKDKEGAVKNIKGSIARSPYKHSYYGLLSDIYLAHKDFEGAVSAAKEAVSRAPWTLAAYQSLSEAYVSAGLHYLETGDKNKAREYFLKCNEIPNDLAGKAEDIPQKTKEVWRDKDVFLALNPDIRMNIGISQIYLGMAEEASKNLQTAYQNEQIRPKASFWLAVLSKKNGWESEAQNYLKEADQNLVQQLDACVALEVVSQKD